MSKASKMLSRLGLAAAFSAQDDGLSPYDNPIKKDKPVPPRMPVNEVYSEKGEPPKGCKVGVIELIEETLKGPIRMEARYFYGTEKSKMKKVIKLKKQFASFARQIDRLVEWHNKYIDVEVDK